jgi:site-specific DNA recombinase
MKASRSRILMSFNRDDTRELPSMHSSRADREAPAFVAVKGIVHRPTAAPPIAPEARDALLAAIAKARAWIEDLRLGRIGTLAEIADREGLGERHVRLLAPLAFVSPAVVAAIVSGAAPADLTVTGLAKALPHSWATQQGRFARPLGS